VTAFSRFSSVLAKLEALSVERIVVLRRAAYAVESDPLKNEAEYGAMINDAAQNDQRSDCPAVINWPGSP